MAIAVVMNRARRPDGPGDPPGNEIGRFDTGHILSVVPDDWQFTPYELAHPAFIFVRLPGVPADYADLVEDQFPEQRLDGSQVFVAPRRVRIRAAAMAALKAEAVPDGAFAKMAARSAAALRAACELHTERSDDTAVIGPPGGGG